MRHLAVALAAVGGTDSPDDVESSAVEAVVTTTTSSSATTSGPATMSTGVPDPDRLVVGPDDLVAYGDAPQQSGQLRLPTGAGDGPFPVMGFIHGGFWRNAFNAGLSEPQAADARSKGYATWNIEYRRVGDEGGGYPGTLDDIAAAIDALARIDAPLDLDRVFVVGHSAGGHLALWVGQRDDPGVVPRLVVGQAPVADLGGSLNLGRGAVEAFMGGLPDAIPEAYDIADPARRLPVKVPQLLVHGLRDDIVPFAAVALYVDAAGDGLDTLVFDDENHFDVIDPAARSWEATLTYLDGI
ncbi:MAG: alpha/beta fold hydrolase [Actinomycetota bacterium]